MTRTSFILIGLALGTGTAAIFAPVLGLVVGGMALILVVAFLGFAVREREAPADHREPDAPQARRRPDIPRRRPQRRVVVLQAPDGERPPKLASARNVVVNGRPSAAGPRFGVTGGVKEEEIEV